MTARKEQDNANLPLLSVAKLLGEVHNPWTDNQSYKKGYWVLFKPQSEIVSAEGVEG